MYTVPPATVGDDSPIPKSAAAARYFHFPFPLARSTACSSPLADPTYTTPSTIAADDSIAPPASYVHNTLRVAGSVDEATPVSAGVFRNCGQLVGTGAAV